MAGRGEHNVQMFQMALLVFKVQMCQDQIAKDQREHTKTFYRSHFTSDNVLK